MVSCGLSLPSGYMQSRPKRPPRAAGTGLVSSHRMKAQILSPSMSTCTEAGGPISLPPGSLAHSPPGTLGPPPSARPLTGRYGLVAGPCASGATRALRMATIPHVTIHPIRLTFDMTHLDHFAFPLACCFAHAAPGNQPAPPRRHFTTDLLVTLLVCSDRARVPLVSI